MTKSEEIREVEVRVVRRLNLDPRPCHVCGGPLKRDVAHATEWCTSRMCDVRLIHFTIPYDDADPIVEVLSHREIRKGLREAKRVLIPADVVKIWYN